jgi:hypothetical protein
MSTTPLRLTDRSETVSANRPPADALDALLTALRQGSDPACREWAAGLLDRGERATEAGTGDAREDREGVAAGDHAGCQLGRDSHRATGDLPSGVKKTGGADR